MIIPNFISALADVQMPDVFNPYAQHCIQHDRTDAPACRRANLEVFLRAAISQSVDTVWIARDLGYRGGRRTGVPLTDEVHLESMSRLFGGLTVERATMGPAVAERTAAIIWRVITQINQPVFLWNVFPFHPHEPGESMSNRCHTREERENTKWFLIALLELLQPRRVVAIGRDAQLALIDLDIEVTPVRHPSYGGQAEFIGGVFSLYGVNESRSKTQPSLF